MQFESMSDDLSLALQLVCTSLEELRELISRTEDELDELENTKKRSVSKVINILCFVFWFDCTVSIKHYIQKQLLHTVWTDYNVKMNDGGNTFL